MQFAFCTEYSEKFRYGSLNIYELSERLLNFAADVIKLVIQLNKTSIGRYIGGQLMRAATSAGANYEEACGAESRADFIHKVQITFKELKETRYWVRLIKKSRVVTNIYPETLLKEVEELISIIAKSIITAKKNK